MVKTFDLKDSLMKLGYDLQHRACGSTDAEELYNWCKNRLYGIKHQQNQFNKFNSAEYKKVHVRKSDE